MPDLPTPEHVEVEPRPSASAKAALAAQLERLRALSPLERMAMALALGRRCRLVAELARNDRMREP